MTEAAAPLKVAIIGTAPLSRHLAPYDDKSWQIWACSAANVNVLPRINVWFELHAVIEMMAPENRAMAEPFYGWLKTKSDANEFNVVMLESNRFVPKAVPFPRDEMIKLFGRNWFTSSVAYMMALAIARGATEIGLFGVDMAAGQEHYEAQRAGCTRFIEIAEERGIKVHVPPESCLKVATPMYGYWEGTPFGRRISATITQVQGALTAKTAQRDALNNEINYFAGAMEQLQYFKRTWTDGSEIEIDTAPMLAAAAEALKATEAAKTVAAPAVVQGTTAPASLVGPGAWKVGEAPVPMTDEAWGKLHQDYIKAAAEIDAAPADGNIRAAAE